MTIEYEREYITSEAFDLIAGAIQIAFYEWRGSLASQDVLGGLLRGIDAAIGQSMPLSVSVSDRDRFIGTLLKDALLGYEHLYKSKDGMPGMNQSKALTKALDEIEALNKAKAEKIRENKTTTTQQERPQ